MPAPANWPHLSAEDAEIHKIGSCQSIAELEAYMAVLRREQRELSWNPDVIRAWERRMAEVGKRKPPHA